MRDSNTGSPDYVPPVAPPVNGGISGPGNPADDTDPPAAVATIERLKLVQGVWGSGELQGTSGAPNNTPYSSEGQRPTLTGLSVEAWYSDGSVKMLTATSAELKTIPAILGKEQINGATVTLTSTFTQANVPAGVNTAVITGVNFDVAAVTTIYVYAGSAVPIPVKIPGVKPLFGAVTNTGTPTNPWPTNTAPSIGSATRTHVVYGNDGNGIRFSGTLTAEFFEDGDAPNSFAGLTVEARYKGLVTGTGTDAAASNVVVWPSEWAALPITVDHIFDDYYTGFSTATSGTRYAYGLDLDSSRLNLLISRGGPTKTISTTTHGGTNNNSVYIAAPFDPDNYHYIRDVEVVSVAWRNLTTVAGTDYDFYLPSAGILNPASANAAAFTAWDNALIANNIALKVYYDNYATPIDRNVDFFRRAVRLGRAGVIGLPDVRDPDEESYGKLRVGYYSAILHSTRGDADFLPDQGEYPNFYEIQLPIASFVEGSAQLKVADNALQDRDLNFVNTGTGRISAAQLEAIRNSYDLYGSFSFGGQPVEMLIIPGSAFTADYFTGTPLRVTEPESVSIELTVPRTETRATYRLYVGEESSFNVMAYPVSYAGRPGLIP